MPPLMWKLIGSPVASAADQSRSQSRIAEVDAERVDDRAAMAERRAALELGGRGVG